MLLRGVMAASGSLTPRRTHAQAVAAASRQGTKSNLHVMFLQVPYQLELVDFANKPAMWVPAPHACLPTREEAAPKPRCIDMQDTCMQRARHVGPCSTRLPANQRGGGPEAPVHLTHTHPSVPVHRSVVEKAEGKVPLIHQGDMWMPDSDAITAWLEEQHPQPSMVSSVPAEV
jgi:hypothetical protein